MGFLDFGRTCGCVDPSQYDSCYRNIRYVQVKLRCLKKNSDCVKNFRMGSAYGFLSVYDGVLGV